MVRVPEPVELAEDLARIEAAVLRGNEETRRSIESLRIQMESTYVRQDVYQIAHKNLSDKVEVIRSGNTWLWRTAVGALVMPIAVAVITMLILSAGRF